jgi:hypothetical protein
MPRDGSLILSDVRGPTRSPVSRPAGAGELMAKACSHQTRGCRLGDVMDWSHKPWPCLALFTALIPAALTIGKCASDRSEDPVPTRR